MDFSWTQEQLKFKQTIIEFAQKELNDNLLERDTASSFSRENWLKCAQIGIQGLAIPEEYGGGRDRSADRCSGYGRPGLRLPRRRADLCP